MKLVSKVSHFNEPFVILVQGDIFLNTSLTEAFCMAILEAVACGLTVVSTKVGGIPEVLPEEFIHFVKPEVKSIEAGLLKAIQQIISRKQPSKTDCNRFVREHYDWRDVTKRTQVVYDAIMSEERRDLAKSVRNLWECGSLAGPLMAVLYLFCHYWILVMDYIGS